MLFALAWRNFGRNRTRSLLSLAAITVGVAGLILSGGFVHDLIYQLGEALIHSQSGHLQIARQGYFEKGSRSPGKYLIRPEEASRLNAGSIGGVDEAMRRISFSGLASNGRSSYPIAGEGIEVEPEAKLGTLLRMTEGRALQAKDRYGAMIGAGVARALGVRAGSGISIVAPTVDEAMNTLELEVIGVFESFSRDYDERVIKIPLAAAQELLDTQGFNVLVLLLRDTAGTAAAAREAQARVEGGTGLEVRTWDWLNDFYWKAVALYDRQFGVLRLVVLVMVVLAIAGAINVAVLERAGEFGTMRALGNRSRDVFRLVIIEGAVLGVLGALAGGVLGAGAALVISQIGIPMPPPPNSNLEFTARISVVPSVIAGSMLVGLAATLLASLAPAVRMARLPVVEALRRVA